MEEVYQEESNKLTILKVFLFISAAVAGECRPPTASPSGESVFRNIAVLFEDAYHPSSASV